MPTFSIDEAENAELYLLGYPETRSGTTGRRRRGLEPYYSQKMKMMEDMASASWDCKVTKVSFGKNFKPDRVHNYFRTAFASKRPGDAVYVYFNGTGIGKHDEYSW